MSEDNRPFVVEDCHCTVCDPENGVANAVTKSVSTNRTPWAVECKEHGLVHLTAHEYLKQLSRPNSFWKCPVCGDSASWSDDEYEIHLEQQERGKS